MRETVVVFRLWFNELVQTEAARFGMRVLHQAGESSVDDLCELVLGKV